MSNSEETSAATTDDQVKLVKVNPKDEALSADDSDSFTLLCFLTLQTNLLSI